MNQEQSIEEMEWLAMRAGMFTGSEISKIMPAPSGRNYKKNLREIDGAMTYIKTKLAERLTLETKEVVDFKQATWGKELEPKGVAAFEKATGLKGIHYGVANPKFFPYGEYAGCSPDWETGEGGEGSDIKCPYNTSEHITNLLIRSAAEYKEERWEYYCQAQMSIKIRNWSKFSAVSYDPRPIEPNLRLKVLPIYPDEQWMKDFKLRLASAIEILEEMRQTLNTSLFVASYDPELNTVIIQK